MIRTGHRDDMIGTGHRDDMIGTEHRDDMIGTGLSIRPVADPERPQLAEFLTHEWGSSRVVSRGAVHDASLAPAIVCFEDDQIAGLATYEISDGECQVLTLDAFRKGRGIGSGLLRALVELAASAGCRRLWLITTNDNLDAIRFYQRRGLRLVAVHPGAVEQARKLKPQIPLVGEYGITIRDELEFELALPEGAS